MINLLPHEELTIFQFVIEGIVKGYSNNELIDILSKDYPNLEIYYFESVIRKAHTKIRESTLTDIDKVIPAHISIYEQIYKELDELYAIPAKMKALRFKEALIGIHKETNNVEIYNEINLTVQVDPNYDLTKLNPDQQKKLQDYLKRVTDK